MDSRITKKQSKVLLDVMKKALLIRDMADKLTEKAVAAGLMDEEHNCIIEGGDMEEVINNIIGMSASAESIIENMPALTD